MRIKRLIAHMRPHYPHMRKVRGNSNRIIKIQLALLSVCWLAFPIGALVLIFARIHVLTKTN